MDWKALEKAANRGAVLICVLMVMAMGAFLGLSRPLVADAAELVTGQWQTMPSLMSAKLAKRVDAALAAQDPKPKVKITTSKSRKYRTVTVNVSCKAKKAGIQNAKSKKEKLHASMRMKLYADNLYRTEKNESRVTCDKTVHGVNNYGRDNATDYSLYVGSDGVVEIYVRYEGLLCLYKNGTFRKANYLGEVYWNQTKRIKVASVKIPKGYRLKLHLTKR